MSEIQKRPALLTIDIQKGFDDPYWGERNNPQAEENIQMLLEVWRDRKWPIIHIQHLSLQLDSPLFYNKDGVAFKSMLQPQHDEMIIHKHVNSAFINTKLESYLREQHIQTVVITGLTTQHCISTTTRMSGNLGFTTFLISDATAAFGITSRNGTYYPPEIIHEISLVTLEKEFATVMSTQEMLAHLEAL